MVAVDNYKVLAYWDTPNGEIKLAEDEFGKLVLYIDDGIQFHEDGEKRYHDSLFTIPACMVGGDEPIRVLVLGGGDGLGTRNLLELPFVESITVVDISPEMVSLALWDKRLSELNKKAFHSKKVRIVIEDAFVKVKQLAKEGEKFDLIILDYPDVPPVLGHQIARLYEREHLEDVKKLLTERGVVSIQAGSYTVLPTYTAYILKTMKKTFGKGFTARVVVKGFPDSVFYYSATSLARPLPENCFTNSLEAIKAFLYADEKKRVEMTLPYVMTPTEAVISDLKRELKNFKGGVKCD